MCRREGKGQIHRKTHNCLNFLNSTLSLLPPQWFLTIYIHFVIYKSICLKAKKEWAYGNFATIHMLDKFSSSVSPSPQSPSSPYCQTGENGHAVGLTKKEMLNSRLPAPCCFLLEHLHLLSSGLMKSANTCASYFPQDTKVGIRFLVTFIQPDYIISQQSSGLYNH